ncbi:MAG TPA: UDP-N-acetylmuramoyl-L-alanine--D-glutamate ligase [Chloroflexota bacterium]|nr:UDP-N-acetylmuramoyl-L-alanine--D-glutamate ligase [Chloroflexota bacterium]
MTRALIIGLGREGLALAQYLTARGTAVTVADGRSVEALGADAERLVGMGARLIAGTDRPDLAGYDVLYLNPAVSKEAPIVADARARGVPVSALTDLFFAVCPAHIAGVTGSNGKTTTTTLLGKMLEAAGLRPYVGGNIGRPLLNETAAMRPDDWVVLEMSSFQLEWLTASPQLAVVTNLTPNHLDRHHTMDEYAAAKLPIVAYQGPDDCAILNAEDQYAARFAQRAGGRVLYFSLVTAPPDGAALEGEIVAIRRGGVSEPVCAATDLRLPGRHNVANALAAIAAADQVGVPATAMREVLRSFTGVPHRLELVRTLAGVTYYNDSIATSPDRALAALQSLSCPLLLILGGHDKNLPWEALCRAAVARCRALLLIGEAAPLIAEHVRSALREAPAAVLQPDRVLQCGDLERAVATAARLATPGDAVLLSPGCASYDQFRNFEERGQRFRQLVEALHGGH